MLLVGVRIGLSSSSSSVAEVVGVKEERVPDAAGRKVAVERSISFGGLIAFGIEIEDGLWLWDVEGLCVPGFEGRGS